MDHMEYSVADKKKLQRAVENERFLQFEGKGNKEFILDKGIDHCAFLFL